MGDIPKLILTVVFLDYLKVRFSLVKIDDFFTKSLKGTKHFFSSTDLIIFEDEKFDINKSYIKIPKDYRFELPIIMSFSSDEDRYEFLNDVRISLIEWSRSIYWSYADKLFSENARIKYNKSIWILY
jgi:hypothetical protein